MFYLWIDREKMRNVLPLDRQGQCITLYLWIDRERMRNTLPLDRQGENA